MPLVSHAAAPARRQGRRLSWVFLLGAALTAGCHVGPDYHPQQPSMPRSWAGPTTAPATRPATQPASAPAAAVDLATWWQVYHDPTLTSLVERASRSNLDLLTAVSRIRQARANRGVAYAALWPTADAVGSYSREFPGGKGPTATPHSLWRAGLDAAWEIDVFGGVQRNVESADADILAAIEDTRNVLVSLTAEVALNYLNLRGFQERIAIAKENLKTQQHSADLTRQKYMGGRGFVGGLDVANAEAQVASTASLIPVLETQVRQTIYSLSVLLALPPAALLEELTPASAVPSAPPEVPLGLPSELLLRRPDIRLAEAQIHAANAQIGVATADLFPKFALTGNFTYQRNKLDGLMNWGSRTWGFGPSVDWQIFTAGRVISNIEVQKALTEQAVLAYAKTVLTALQDVENAMIAYSYEHDHRKALAEAVVANRKAVAISIQLYSLGQNDFLSVLDAQRSLLASEDALSASTTSLSTDLVALYKALGGGWEGAAPSPAPQRLGSAPEPFTMPAASVSDIPTPVPASAPSAPMAPPAPRR